jgi:hypothetical protein
MNKKLIALENDCVEYGNSLTCPGCEEINLHQESCITFWREKEDSIECNTTLTKHKLTENKDMYWASRNNPSERRDGLLIQFNCEHCDCDPVLGIWQHKGTTFIAWHSMRVKL